MYSHNEAVARQPAKRFFRKMLKRCAKVLELW